MEELNVVGAKVPFQLNKASFGNQVTAVLDIVYGIMQKYPTTKFVIEGHTDTTGPKAFNQKLSEERAQSIVDYMVNKGIATNRFQVVGYGETKPIATNINRAGRKLNRRVEVVVD